MDDLRTGKEVYFSYLRHGCKRAFASGTAIRPVFSR
jgi:hypothetical protein